MDTYEKKYNEALKRARELVAKWTGKNKDFYIGDYSYIFPELRESEDERVIRTLYYLVRDHDWLNGATKGEALTWLEKQKESLHISETCKENADSFTSEQKPAWSEEDKDMLNCCISSIEEAKENRYAYKETDGDTSYDREIAFLKSLRPSWKPSEEQMDSLRDTIVQTKGYSYSMYLPDLYEQLKKL